MENGIRLRWAGGMPGGSGKGLAPTLAKYLRPGTVIDPAPPSSRGPRHLEYHFYQALIMLDMLKNIKEAENLGYDGAVIGCFYDPGLRVAREIVDKMVVTAPAESSMHIAATLGHRFSIIVGRKKWIPLMQANVVEYGFSDKLASFRSVDMGVLDFHKDEAKTASRIHEEAKKAITCDRAEVVILGCTATHGFFEELQKDLSVPVVDCALAALKYAEFLVDLRRALGWSHSKVCDYESPPSHELVQWQIARDYGLGKLWQ